MSDGEDKHVSIFYIQPTMAKLVALSVGVWGVGAPIVIALKTGDLELLLLAPVGLALVPLVVMLVAFARTLLWVYLVIYWYARGVAAVLSITGFALFAVVALTTPEPLVTDSLRPFLQTLPRNESAIAAGAVVLVVLVASALLSFSLRRKREKLPDPMPPPVVAAPAAPTVPTPKPLTYLQDRPPRP